MGTNEYDARQDVVEVERAVFEKDRRRIKACFAVATISGWITVLAVAIGTFMLYGASVYMTVQPSFHSWLQGIATSLVLAAICLAIALVQAILGKRWLMTVASCIGIVLLLNLVFYINAERPNYGIPGLWAADTFDVFQRYVGLQAWAGALPFLACIFLEFALIARLEKDHEIKEKLDVLEDLESKNPWLGAERVQPDDGSEPPTRTGLFTDQQRIKTLQKLVRVTSKIKMETFIDILGIDKADFARSILDWADRFGFRIDGDFIIIENADIDGFIANLDSQFADWKSKESTKHSKI